MARMDHHCIYAANCIGAGNHKQFVLLLLYSAACAAHANLLYFRVLGRGLVGGSPKIASSGVAKVAAAEATATAAQYSASAWQEASTSSSSSWSSLWLLWSSFPLISDDGGGGAGLRCWHRVASVARGILLPVLAVAVLSWLVALLSVHLYGVAVDAGTVDRMQAASAARRAEETAVVVAAAAGPVRSMSASDRGRQSLLYRVRALPSRGGFPLSPGGLLGFLEGEKSTGIALRSTTGTRNIDSSSSSGGSGATAPSVVGESARSPALSLARHREGGFQKVVGCPGNPLGTGAADATAATAGVVDTNIEDCRGARNAASLCSSRGLWRTLQEEVVGDGPWMMWFVPLPAKLAPEVRERLFASSQGQERGGRFSSSRR